MQEIIIDNLLVGKIPLNMEINSHIILKFTQKKTDGTCIDWLLTLY